MSATILLAWKKLQASLLALLREQKPAAEDKLPQGCSTYKPSKTDLRLGDVVAIYTRKEGSEDAFHVGTVLAISREKIRVQYWQCTKSTGTWSKTSLRRVGSSFSSSRNLDMREHTGIIWAADGVIDKIPSLQGKSRGSIDRAHLQFLRSEAQRYRKKSLQTLKGDLRSFKNLLAQESRENVKVEEVGEASAERSFRRLVSGAMSLISRSSSFSSNFSESSGVDSSFISSSASDTSEADNGRLKRLTTV